MTTNEKIIEFISMNPNSISSEIAKGIEINPKTLSGNLTELKKYLYICIDKSLKMILIKTSLTSKCPLRLLSRAVCPFMLVGFYFL